MVSQRKSQANRANARASTGPKTAKGKARASQNARRHGLSLPVVNDPVLCAEVEELARKTAGENASPEMLQSAFKFAEAQVDIDRIRRVRRDLLTHELSNRNYQPKRTVLEESRRVRWAIYFGEIFNRNLPRPPGTLGAIVDLVGPTPFNRISLEIAKRIASLDRYERRALSRRKFAIRDFDAARSQGATIRGDTARISLATKPT